MSGPGEDARAHMDGIYRHQRFIYDATRKYFLLGRDRLLDDLKPPAGGSVLEVACGTGRNLILAARRYPDARFYGFDISAEMLKTARASVKAAGLSGRIALAQADATAFDPAALFGQPAFERVFVSYALSMIPPWRAALAAAFEAVAGGGRLHVVDFGDQHGLPRWFKSMLRAWLRRFSVEPRAELPAALGDIARTRAAQLMLKAPFGGYAHYAVLEKR